MTAKRDLLKTWLDRALKWICSASPLEATQLGLHDEDHRVDDLGHARLSHAEELRDLIAAIPRFSDPDDRLDAEALRAYLSEILILEYEFNLPGRAAGYMTEQFFSALFHQVNGSYAPPVERFQALLYRLREVQRMLGQNLLAIRQAAEAGAVPRVWTIHGMSVAEDSARYLFTLRRHLPRRIVSPALRRAVADELTRSARAFQEYRVDLRRRILPKSRPLVHAAGAGLFSRLMHEAHLLPNDLSEFVRSARDEAAEIRRRLEALSLQLTGKHNWREAQDILAADHPPASRLIESYRDVVERLARFVRKKRLSRVNGDGTLRVSETPAFERASIPYAAYQGPAPFEAHDLRGYFFVTPPDRRASKVARRQHLRESPRAAICVTAAHEGFPGHHLQHLASHASRRPVRRMVWDSFFGEGWAHYAESWVFREGFPSDERTEFYLLKDRLWRCVRVGLDVDIHMRKMPLRRAAEILSSEAGLSPSGAHGEIVRYSLEPTQPMSYFVGRRFIETLAEDGRRRLGRRFDTAAFHDSILELGAVPLALIRERIETGRS